MSQIIEVKVPDIGNFKDVPIIDVLVKVGDTVKAEDALLTLESDKATIDIPSPADGVIAELTAIHLQEHTPRFLHQRLYDGEYVVVMRRDHPLAGQPLTIDAYCAARHLL